MIDLAVGAALIDVVLLQPLMRPATYVWRIGGSTMTSNYRKRDNPNVA